MIIFTNWTNSVQRMFKKKEKSLLFSKRLHLFDQKYNKKVYC